jgi:3-methyl-2-oxobutanoate hydroxymethyltransferase
VDCILVGDSAAMTMHGLPSTLGASIEMMALHTTAVARGAPQKFIIGDLPFLSYRQGLTENMQAVKLLMQAGAHSVKLEGAAGNLELIRHIVDSGVPVMGHLGLTPQSIYALGGFKVQGKTDAAQEKIMLEAQQLQEAGCFAVVLECVPAPLAKAISEQLQIPTIGIGAGADTDGQVLVFQDLLGLNTEFKPKFVKSYINGAELFTTAINSYIHEVQQGAFPKDEHCY